MNDHESWVTIRTYEIGMAQRCAFCFNEDIVIATRWDGYLVDLNFVSMLEVSVSGLILIIFRKANNLVVLSSLHCLNVYRTHFGDKV